MMKPRGAKAFLFHVVALVFYGYILHRLQINHSTSVPTDNPLVKNARLFFPRFFTMWTFTLQGAYFAATSVTFILGLIPYLKGLMGKVDRLWSYFSVSVVTPSALLVSTVFWGIYVFDRNLILPKELDVVLPPWLNHSIHSANAILGIIDLYLVNHSYGKFGNAVKGIIAYLLVYSVCLFGTFFQTGLWLYPFLEHFTPPMMGAFVVGSLVATIGFYCLTKLISKTFWGAPTVEKASKKSKKKRY